MEWCNPNKKSARERKYAVKNIPTEDERMEAEYKQKKITEYLDANPEYLAKYVEEKVSVDTFHKWHFAKVKTIVQEKSIEYSTIGKTHFLDLIATSKTNELQFIWELASTIVESMKGEAFCIFKVHPGASTHTKIICIDPKGPQPQPLKLVGTDYRDKVYIREAARRETCLYLPQNTDLLPLMQPGCLFTVCDFHGKLTDLEHVLLVPVLNENGDATYMIKIWRTYLFDQVDMKIAGDFLVWASVAKAYVDRADTKKKLLVTDFLMDTVKSIFEEMATLDLVTKRIQTLAQKLVNADRACLFLVDWINQELVSTVFELKSGEPYRNIKKKEIRIPIDTGIPGHVVITGQPVNISNAYADPRFNREVDEATGYQTTSILCMPIKIKDCVIGVVKMTNKREQLKFTTEDEECFEIFSTFFALALKHANLHEKTLRNEQKYKVTLELLSYHATCRDSEVKDFLNLKQCDEVPNLDDFSLDPSTLSISTKCQTVMTMFERLFSMRRFNKLSLIRFVLTVKKNYRDVPYHNFEHAWTVAHAMYVILRNDKTPQRLRHIERLALFVASLCHDLDHRGFTYKYTSETASPLAAVYTTSTLEHHHFNMTVMILQQEGHNIFAYYTRDEYEEILSLIRLCILATDLTKFSPHLKCIQKLINADKFDWRDDNHRQLFMAISMTAADLSASAKPWAVQLKTVRVIFQEFYEQGDQEKEEGLRPHPLLDRNNPDHLPAHQVKFLKQICVPCYEVMEIILPETRTLLKTTWKNLMKWQATTLEKSLRTKLGTAYMNTGTGCIGLSQKNYMNLSPVLETRSLENDSQQDTQWNTNACSRPDDPLSLTPASLKMLPSPDEQKYLETAIDRNTDTAFPFPPISMLQLPEIGESNKTIHSDSGSANNSSPTKLASTTLGEATWLDEDEDESLNFPCIKFGCARQKKKTTKYENDSDDSDENVIILT